MQQRAEVGIHRQVAILRHDHTIRPPLGPENAVAGAARALGVRSLRRRSALLGSVRGVRTTGGAPDPDDQHRTEVGLATHTYFYTTPAPSAPRGPCRAGHGAPARQTATRKRAHKARDAGLEAIAAHYEGPVEIAEDLRCYPLGTR